MLMDMRFETEEWAIAPVRTADARPEWHVLLARLQAARATNRALARAGVPAFGGASFDCDTARLVTNLARKRAGVNLFCSEGGNAEADILAPVADEPTSGDRG
jgi:hypothetical protein